MLYSRSFLTAPVVAVLLGSTGLACSGDKSDDTGDTDVHDHEDSGDTGDTGNTGDTGFDPDATVTVELASGANVVVYDFGDLWLHNYNDNPANGVGNATYVIESENSLVLIDAQFFPDSAADFRDYIDGLGKPIDRMLITHGHPDHVGGLATAFADVPSYSSAGVIEEALADSGAVIGNELDGDAVIDGVTYAFDVRNNLEAAEQVIISLPDHGIIALGDLFYNEYHAVMNPGFDGWIDALAAFEDTGAHLFLAGHGAASTESDAIAEAVGYLETGRDTYASASNPDDFYAAMVAAYPDYAGPFLLQLSAYEYLYPTPHYAVSFGDCDELATGSAVPLSLLQAELPAGIDAKSLTDMGTVFPGSDDLGILITRVLSCDSVTVDGTTDTAIHIAHVGTTIDPGSLPASPFSTDGHNGADFSNYSFSYVTDSPAFLDALTGAGVNGAGSASISFSDTSAGDCIVDREVVVSGGSFGFSASGTIPEAACEASVVPFVGNWWNVTDGAATVVSQSIAGQSALFLDLAATPVTLDADDSSDLSAFIGDAARPVDGFGFAGFIPGSEAEDMVITVVAAE